MRLCFVDVETTGTDHCRHQVWEIGLVVREGQGESEHCWQVRPGLATADPAALRVGGYHARCQVRDAPQGAVATLAGPSSPASAGELASVLAGMLDGATLAGVNVAFDRDFLAAFLRSHGQCLTADYHLADVCPLAAGWLHGRGIPVPRGWRSDDLARAAGIDPARYGRHTALGDARFARDIYDAVTGQSRAAFLPTA